MCRPRFVGGIGSKALRILEGNRAIIIADEPCWDCDGEGHYLQDVPGGYYDSAQEQWYPDEEDVECETCHGEGVLFGVERCGRCAEDADDCECDEDDMAEWLLGVIAIVDQAEWSEREIEVDWNTAHYIAARYKREAVYKGGKVFINGVNGSSSTIVGVCS